MHSVDTVDKDWECICPSQVVRTHIPGWGDGRWGGTDKSDMEWATGSQGFSTPKLALSVYLKDNFERTSTEDTHLRPGGSMALLWGLIGLSINLTTLR